MQNKISDLRNHLFETLEALKDKETPMELPRAKAICEVAQTIINAAKVETDFVKAISAEAGSEFFETRPRERVNGKPRPSLAIKGTSEIVR